MAETITVTIDGDYLALVQKMATDAGVTTTVFVRNVLKAWLVEQIRSRYINKIQSLTPEQILTKFGSLSSLDSN